MVTVFGMVMLSLQDNHLTFPSQSLMMKQALLRELDFLILRPSQESAGYQTMPESSLAAEALQLERSKFPPVL